MENLLVSWHQKEDFNLEPNILDMFISEYHIKEAIIFIRKSKDFFSNIQKMSEQDFTEKMQKKYSDKLKITIISSKAKLSNIEAVVTEMRKLLQENFYKKSHQVLYHFPFNEKHNSRISDIRSALLYACKSFPIYGKLIPTKINNNNYEFFQFDTLDPYSQPEDSWLKQTKIDYDIDTVDPVMNGLLKDCKSYKEHGFDSFLLTGETGVGKERIVKFLTDDKYIPVNIASITETLFESSLFGHVKGAFTGASTEHIGFIEQAHKDNKAIFLDEIGLLPVSLQVKLLRTVETKEINKVGSTKIIKLPNLRIIFATSSPENIYKDLLYRISCFVTHIPPLRERPNDIESIANSIVDKLNKNATIAPETFEILKNLRLDGNIRELSNIIERAYIFSDNHSITEKDIKKSLNKALTFCSSAPVTLPLESDSINITINPGTQNINMDNMIAIFKKSLCKATFRYLNTNKKKELAKFLNVSEATISRLT